MLSLLGALLGLLWLPRILLTFGSRNLSGLSGLGNLGRRGLLVRDTTLVLGVVLLGIPAAG